LVAVNFVAPHTDYMRRNNSASESVSEASVFDGFDQEPGLNPKMSSRGTDAAKTPVFAGLDPATQGRALG
jgi:hypothetical protein